jgi:2,4-dienoyl-CoA reductase (NADPH2)
MLAKEGFSDVVIATGVNPRTPEIEGIDHPKVLSYIEVLNGTKPVGQKVAVIGAGGIGFDVSEFLSHGVVNMEEPMPQTVEAFMDEWGVDTSYQMGGALKRMVPQPSAREIYLLKRSRGKHGDGLGKTTGWIHRASLKMKRVNMLSSVQYDKIDDHGLHITVDGKQSILEVDNVVICAGQLPNRELLEPLKAAGIETHLIGGANEAAELDAKRAIEEGLKTAIGL